jgi:type IV pilus assembly protein PilC
VAEFLLKYADPRGEIHQQVAVADSEREVRDRFSQQGLLIYSVRARNQVGALPTPLRRKKKKFSTEKFLIFNQQFMTLIRAGLPIVKSLDLLSERLADPKLGVWIKAVRDEVRTGTLLSEAFRRQEVFPPIYVTSVMAGEKSGSLADVLERYVVWQKLAVAVRKKMITALIYPSLLMVMVVCLIVFLITYVVPNFAELYRSMSATLPAATRILIAVGTTARNYILLGIAGVFGAAFGFWMWSKTDAGEERVDRIRMKMPVFGEVWLKYLVAQFSRILSTLLVGGIPLVQALDTAANSIGSRLLKVTLEDVTRLVKEGQSLSAALVSTKVFPDLSIDMIEVGESTGALSAMLNSVADFYEDDVTTRITAALSLIEPAIMIFMGVFVTFVLVALYLPIFSLADSLR